MMKKMLSFIAAFLVLGGALFADVTVKDLGDGNVEVTFLYKGAGKEVVVAGDFTDWQNGALPMTKTDNGFELKKTFPMATTLKYKFIVDGTWLFDSKSPDKTDDGFGGFNGIVDVAKLVAVEKAKASGDSAALEKLMASQSGLKFGTWSMIGVQGKYDSKNMELQSVGVGVKSYAKISGEAVKNVPIYVEVAVFENDGFENIYKKDSLDADDGLKNLLVDTFFDPLYYYGGQKKAGTYLGHFKAGFNSPYVNFLTGYKYAKLTPHTNVSWTTVDNEWEAGYSEVGGFSEFSLGSALQKIGDITINATIAPNRTADRAGNQYGIYSFVNAQMGDHYVDFQYNAAFNKTYDTIFDDIYEADFIGGYKGVFGPLTLKTNMLYNVWGSVKVNDTYKIAYNPSSSDVSGVKEGKDFLYNSAVNIQFDYTALNSGITVGYRYRGAQASMMYVEDGNADGHTHISDQLGDVNTQRIFLNGFVNPLSTVKVSMETYADMALLTDYDKLAAYQKPYVDKANTQLFFKPSFDVNLESLLSGIPSSVSVYSKLKYNTSDKDKFTYGSDKSQFALPEAGLKFNMNDISDLFKDVTVYYGFDNNDSNYLFNTLIGTVTLPEDLSVQTGLGLRTANKDVADTDYPFGMFLGVSKKLKAAQKPIVYGQVLYNMDPYKDFGDGQEALKLDGYVTDDGQSDFAGLAAFRIGMRWDF
ncbi:glycogen-binding domain-containing protein [Gracilinema caldarium]|nr:glycogen-binding domain-containing protein [Gracilinema caldarium]